MASNTISILDEISQRVNKGEKIPGITNGASSILTAVRIRPMMKKERDKRKDYTKRVISVNKKETCINTSHPQQKPCAYTYSYNLNSAVKKKTNMPKYISQADMFNIFGKMIIYNTMSGFNCTMFAYGQTGSGKTYTMMGHNDRDIDVGLIPRICKSLFRECKLSADKRNSSGTVFKYEIEASFIEIYAQKAKDLLAKNFKKAKPLKIREHRKFGPYAEGLRKIPVNNPSEIKSVIEIGNSRRTVRGTNMNDKSSRSHSIFSIYLKIITATKGGTTMEQSSQINMVDLAGTENVQHSGVTGEGLEEAKAINTSLSALTLVVRALVNNSRSRKSKHTMVPYRNSTLTWLLKESLGGNSRTIILANVSPAICNYLDTINTLKWVAVAGCIKVNAKKNTETKGTTKKYLESEIRKLRAQLKEQKSKPSQSGSDSNEQNEELVNELKRTEQMLAESQKTFEQKIKEREAVHRLHIDKMKKSYEESERKVAELKKVNNDELVQSIAAVSNLGIKSISEELREVTNELKLKYGDTTRMLKESYAKEKAELLNKIQRLDADLQRVTKQRDDYAEKNRTLLDNATENQKQMTDMINNYNMISQRCVELDNKISEMTQAANAKKLCEQEAEKRYSDTLHEIKAIKDLNDDLESKITELQTNQLAIVKKAKEAGENAEIARKEAAKLSTARIKYLSDLLDKHKVNYEREAKVTAKKMGRLQSFARKLRLMKQTVKQSSLITPVISSTPSTPVTPATPATSKLQITPRTSVRNFIINPDSNK